MPDFSAQASEGNFSTPAREVGLERSPVNFPTSYFLGHQEVPQITRGREAAAGGPPGLDTPGPFGSSYPQAIYGTDRQDNLYRGAVDLPVEISTIPSASQISSSSQNEQRARMEMIEMLNHGTRPGVQGLSALPGNGASPYRGDSSPLAAEQQINNTQTETGSQDPRVRLATAPGNVRERPREDARRRSGGAREDAGRLGSE